MSEPGKIHAAIIAVMRAVGPIAKASQNSQQNYKFRGVDAVYNVCHPHLAEHGVYCTSQIVNAQHDTREVMTKAGKSCLTHAILHMKFTYHADDGSSVSTEVIGEGQDYNGDKASNKAMSIADKYALLQLLKIPTAMEDSDKNQNTPPARNPNSPRQQPRGERVSPAMLSELIASWKAVHPDETEADWSRFVAKATGREFAVRSIALWSMSEYRAVEEAIEWGAK